VYCLIKYPISNLSIPCSISKTTLKVLTTELPELVKYEQCSSLPKLNFQSLHYHQLILRLGQYRYLGDYKKLKLLYYEYNDTIFGGVLSKQYVVGIFDCTSKSYAASGFQVGGVNHILISAQNFNIQDKFSDNLKMTLMHEMCHAYTEYKYGTAVENEGEGGESVGVTGYYKEHYADQMKYHGKHFKEATMLCQEKSKYAWQDIFDYGLALNKWQSSEDTDEDYGRKALAPKNAFNSGQSYRKVYSFNLSSSTFCRQHGIINCKCNSTDKIQLYDGRYLGYCKSCGNVEIFDDSTIGTKGVNPDYFDVIDRYGLVYFTKCSKCGKTHLIPIIADYDDNKSSLANYLSDLNFADRYVNHIWQICEANKSKYEGYFIKNFNCSVKLSRDIMPVLNIEFISEQNTIYKYKFFISCNGKRKPVGKLYRDYDYNYSGYLLHTFRIMTDKDVLLFFNYIMSYVRKDMRKD
jgi:hypothetical protein